MLELGGMQGEIKCGQAGARMLPGPGPSLAAAAAHTPLPRPFSDQAGQPALI